MTVAELLMLGDDRLRAMLQARHDISDDDARSLLARVRAGSATSALILDRLANGHPTRKSPKHTIEP